MARIKRPLSCLLVFLGGVCYPGPVWAGQAGLRDGWSPTLDLTIKGSYYHDAWDRRPEDTHLAGDLTIGLSRFLSDRLTLRVDPRINFDSLNTAGAQPFVEDREGRPAVTLNEAYLGWFGDTTELYAGKKIYCWKVADAFSPLDTLNPVDILDLPDPRKIGIPSLSLMKMTEFLNVQAVWLPFFVPDRLADDGDRWAGDDIGRRLAFYTQYGVMPQLVDAGRDLPHSYDKMSGAARISSCSLISGWDLALVFRHGYSTRGVIRNSLPTLPKVYQTTEYPAYTLYGFSFSTTAGEVEFHGEAGFHDSRDNIKDEDYLAYIGGINYTNYDLLTDWVEEIRIALEFAGEEIARARPANSTYSDQGAQRGMTSNLIASLRFKINEDHLIKTSTSFNTADEDALGEIRSESQLTEHLKLTLGYQMLSGDPDTFFGQWDANDRVYVQIKMTY